MPDLFRVRIWLLIGIIVVTLSLAACGEQPPEREFSSRDLLLPIDEMPPGWEISGDPHAMGPAYGFGDEDDAALQFKSAPEKYTLASHYVLRFPSLSQASAWYQEYFPSEFNSNSVAVSTPWTTPREWTFDSSSAIQQHAACTINNVAYEKEVCKFMGQYEEFVVIFWSVIRPDLMTRVQFESSIESIDLIMQSHLDR